MKINTYYFFISRIRNLELFNPTFSTLNHFKCCERIGGNFILTVCGGKICGYKTVQVYGSLIGDGSKMTILHNSVGGHILRTKLENVNEGGVAIGAAVIDTPFLV